MSLSGHFIDSKAGRIFLTVTGSLPADKVILCLPPLFEEMNLARAVIAKQAQSFADHGYTTCIVDYYGTGDSEGETNLASAELWIDDIVAASHWLLQQGAKRLVVWGVRFGGLLLLHYQKHLHEELPICSQLLWKPLTDGKRYISQLMRLRQAGSLIRGSREKIDWRGRVAMGETVEVAGYPVNEQLLASIEALNFSGSTKPQSNALWLELGAPEVPPAVGRLLAKWPYTDYELRAIPGPLFWQIPETFSVPELHPHGLALVGR